MVKGRFPVYYGSGAFALHLEECGLLVEPFLRLLLCQALGRFDGFLLRFESLAGMIIAHGDDDQVASATFAYACHCNPPCLTSFLLRPFL